MSEKPIIFSTPMAQALLNTKSGIWPAEPIDPDRPYKRMTRRVVKPRYKPGEVGFEVSRQSLNISIVDEEGMTVREGGPKYWSGDILWVRETFTKTKEGDHIYRSDPMFDEMTKGDFSWSWTSPLFLPHKAARIFLKVKDVRIERLQDITPEDVLNEGLYIKPPAGCDPKRPENWNKMTEKEQEKYIANIARPTYMAQLYYGELLVTKFKELWDILNAKRGYSWDGNPWVWVYEFMRLS
jgi:hypothetical protein